MVDLEALEALLKAARPGPWRWAKCGPDCHELISGVERVLYRSGDSMEFAHGLVLGDRVENADATFIAAAPTAIAAMIAELRELRAIKARIEAAPVGHIIDLADELKALERSGKTVALLVIGGGDA